MSKKRKKIMMLSGSESRDLMFKNCKILQLQKITPNADQNPDIADQNTADPDPHN
jgi:hypothetical protein